MKCQIYSVRKFGCIDEHAWPYETISNQASLCQTFKFSHVTHAPTHNLRHISSDANQGVKIQMSLQNILQTPCNLW